MVVQLEKIDAASVAVFAVVEGNCSNGVKGQLRTKDQYMDNKMKGNISQILTQLKDITSGLEVTTNKHALFYDSLKDFMAMHQWLTESDDAFT